MTLKELPMSTHTFRKIIEWNCVYVDKTKEAYELAKKTSYFFLSRPRRFWKSLFLDTLQNIFEGNKELFKWLYIYDKWDFNDKYPVIKISWAGDLSSLKKLEIRAIDILEENQERLGIECNTDEVTSCFNRLIKRTYKKYNKPVVILVDEYNKPILDVIEDTELAKKHRKFLKEFYNVLKNNDKYIRFVFFTWVTKLSKQYLFSNFNMLEDITISSKFWNIGWFTIRELKENFSEYLQSVNFGIKDLQEYIWWYFFWKDELFNPASLFDTLFAGTIKSTWIPNNTPSMFIKLLKKYEFYKQENLDLQIPMEEIDNFDLENITFEKLLYHVWFLRIEKVIRNEHWERFYKLKFSSGETKRVFDYLKKEFWK